MIPQSLSLLCLVLNTQVWRISRKIIRSHVILESKGFLFTQWHFHYSKVMFEQVVLMSINRKSHSLDACEYLYRESKKYERETAAIRLRIWPCWSGSKVSLYISFMRKPDTALESVQEACVSLCAQGWTQSGPLMPSFKIKLDFKSWSQFV